MGLTCAEVGAASRSDGMVYFLSSSNTTDGDVSGQTHLRDSIHTERIADLKVFWGPEICRLEYLLHLVETGRIKDEERGLEGEPTA
jgi:hypothetical protein